ncbi:MAG: UDP-3-O-acyl-N-acetylglucosamine deacetylase, partial [Thermodesulfobacteriota bacterium]
LSNAVVIGDTEILNKDGLRYPDEFVRHKVLDVMGDLALLGAPVIGRLSAYRSGHALNHRMVRKVLKNNLKWDLTEKPFTKKGFTDSPAPYLYTQVLAHA